jgi:hypothetical protein
MRTYLFAFFLLFFGCSFSSFANEPVRPDGWYYVIDMETDSLSASPIVTLKDFDKLKLDSIQNAETDSITYRISGRLTAYGTKVWAEATERSIGKHVAFLFNGDILIAPYVNARIENGNFSIITGQDYDMKLLYEQIRRASGCTEEFGFVDELSREEIVTAFWLMRGGLIILVLVILSLGFLWLRKIKKATSK